MTIALATLTGTSPAAFINTLLQDPEGIYDDFVERYHTQSLSRLLCQNAAVAINRGNGCILHNYEPLPTPKINQLVIPTGATRWSYCLLLADDERKNDIYTACDNGSRTMNLIFGSPITGRQETEHAIVLTVYVLPPRQLSPTSDVPPPGQRPEPPNPLPPGYVAPTPVDPNISRLWLIPVVDERYYWQFKHTETLSTTAASTETDYTIPDNAVDLLLGMAAGTNYKNPGVNTAYDEGISPSCLSNNDYENLPIVMDSILTHYGQRLVVDIGCWDNTAEKYKVADLESPPTGRTRFAVLDGLNSISVFNSSMQGKLGLKNCTWVNSTNATPSASAESLTVGKPFIVAGGVSSSYGTSENYKAYASTPSSVDIQTVAGTYVNKTPETGKYKTAAVTAIWRTEFASEPPSTLVTQIGVDYFYQFYRQFDYTFAGVQPWQQTYFDDYMVIRQTWNSKTEGYDAYTRVCSRQPNMSGEWVTPVAGSGAPRIRFTILSASFTVGFGALGCDHVVVLVKHISCGGTGVSVGDEVKVYDPEYCHFNLPIELLVGLSGAATLMKSENYQAGLDYVLYCLDEIRAVPCMWMIDTLCCSEEEVISG